MNIRIINFKIKQIINYYLIILIWGDNIKILILFVVAILLLFIYSSLKLSSFIENKYYSEEDNI